MLSCVGKCLLGVTTLALLGFVYTYLYYRNGCTDIAIILVTVSILLVFLCLWFIKYIKENIQESDMVIASIEAGDRENIAFVLLYLMPVFTAEISSINLDAIIATAILLLIFFSAGYYYQFNPVLSLFRWHFYKISTPEGVTYLLITKKQLRRNNITLKVHRFAEYIVVDGE